LTLILNERESAMSETNWTEAIERFREGYLIVHQGGDEYCRNLIKTTLPDVLSEDEESHVMGCNFCTPYYLGASLIMGVPLRDQLGKEE
jgi:hypothetical protein